MSKLAGESESNLRKGTVLKKTCVVCPISWACLFMNKLF